jgi:hypothetical protein
VLLAWQEDRQKLDFGSQDLRLVLEKVPSRSLVGHHDYTETGDLLESEPLGVIDFDSSFLEHVSSRQVHRQIASSTSQS